MMTSIKVSQVATLPAGVKLRLADRQAQPRHLRMESVGKGLYKVLEPVQFKVGETFDVELDGLPKALLGHLTVLQGAAKMNPPGSA